MEVEKGRGCPESTAIHWLSRDWGRGVRPSQSPASVTYLEDRDGHVLTGCVKSDALGFSSHSGEVETE